MRLDAELQRRLLALARASIEHGLEARAPVPVALADWPRALQAPTATFVTIEKHGTLRGCRGVLTPVRPLPDDIAQNAFDTAFGDPRFPPVAAAELAELTIEISVLTPMEPVQVRGFRALGAQLEPGVHGLTIASGANRATFLPKVWEQLPDWDVFHQQLWSKAGLEPGVWPADLRAWRYRAPAFGER